MKRYYLLILAAIILCGSVTAKGVPGFRTEFGVVAGVNQPFAKFNMGSSQSSISQNTGFTAGIHMGLRIAGIIGIQPEILFSHNKLNIKDKTQNFTSDIKCNTVQIPLLLSIRLAIVRLNVGPVFTVMDNPTYLDRRGEKVLFGPLYPTISYSAGASVCILKKILIDARIMSGFKAMENCLSYDVLQQSSYIKTTMFNAQLKVGILF